MVFSYNNLLEMMEKVGSTFNSVTGQSISFMGTNGDYVLPLNYNLFSDFCNYVIHSEKGCPYCKECNFDFKNMNIHETRITQCHMGLTTISAPIRIDDKCETIVTCGQIIMEGTEHTFFDNLFEKASQLNLDYSMLLEKSKRLKRLTKDETLSRSQFLLLLTEYISITEAELSARSKYLDEYKQKMKLENKLRTMEFRFLQSQISPHFLFNTLNLLARTAQNEGASTTAGLVYDLSDLLHWGYKCKDSICPLREEFKCVKSYLHLQKARFGDKLGIHFHLDETVADHMIPVLTIQPLVENVILHGNTDNDEKMNISINAREENGFISIDIIDTGKGIPEQKLQEIRKHENSGTGIKNVEERLNLYFGKRVQFYVNSVVNKGTSINICWKVDENEVYR